MTCQCYNVIGVFVNDLLHCLCYNVTGVFVLYLTNSVLISIQCTVIPMKLRLLEVQLSAVVQTRLTVCSISFSSCLRRLKRPSSCFVTVCRHAGESRPSMHFGSQIPTISGTPTSYHPGSEASFIGSFSIVLQYTRLVPA